MSIHDATKAQVTALLGNRLFVLPPLIPSDPSVRTLFVSREVRDDVTPPWPDNYDGYRLSVFRGTLDAFTRGDLISVSEDPFDKPPNTFLARVHPVGEEVWDIRCSGGNPQIRCFGRFLGKDVFVALTWSYRDNLNWEDEREDCKSAYDALFASCPLFRGGSLDDYLSNFSVG